MKKDKKRRRSVRSCKDSRVRVYLCPTTTGSPRTNSNSTSLVIEKRNIPTYTTTDICASTCCLESPLSLSIVFDLLSLHMQTLGSPAHLLHGDHATYVSNMTSLNLSIYLSLSIYLPISYLSMYQSLICLSIFDLSCARLRQCETERQLRSRRRRKIRAQANASPSVCPLPSFLPASMAEGLRERKGFT